MSTLKPLQYEDLDGISQKQLTEHHDVLYAGYIKKADEITAKLKLVDLTLANATYSELRSLKVEETFAQNGVKLHDEECKSIAINGREFMKQLNYENILKNYRLE